jgi:hypothetical protein
VLLRALCAEPPEYELAFAKYPVIEGARGWFGNVVPINVLNLTASVADEVMMLYAFRIEARGAAFSGHLTH